MAAQQIKHNGGDTHNAADPGTLSLFGQRVSGTHLKDGMER